MVYLQHVDKVNLPKPVYGGIVVRDSKICFSVNNSREHYFIEPAHNVLTSITSWLRQYSAANEVKIIAIGFVGNRVNHKLFSKLWLDFDIVPLLVTPEHINLSKAIYEVAHSAAEYTQRHFDENHSFAAKVGFLNKVETPPLVSLEDYEEITPPEEFSELLRLTKIFQSKQITYFSATPQGGGVAIMRHALLRLFDLLKVNASWHVMSPNADIFSITKQKFHNVLQSVHQEGTILTDEDKDAFEKWSLKNVNIFAPVIEKSDVIVIDDPQPSGMIPHIKQINPKVKLVFRSHIQLLADLANTPGTVQHRTWSYIWNNIMDVDLFVAHPVNEFVPIEVDKDKLIKMPPSTDPLDGLNKELTDEQKAYYLAQTPLDPNRPYITQIARFDPSKGIPDVLEAYAKLRALLTDNQTIPQLAIVGNSSIDDPDGRPIYDMTIDLIENQYKNFADDIKVIRAPHYDQLMNTILRRASVALQLSHKEGFEFKITEALMKGVPTIIYDSGGMPLQVKDGYNGFIVHRGDTDKVAHLMKELFTNPELYKTISSNALKDYYKEATTIPNAIKWLKIANDLLSN